MTKKALRIGVVGIPGKWSTESLADAIEQKTGFRLVIDIEKVVADLSVPNVMFQDNCLCELDGIIIKKISETYSPTVIDRLEILRFVEKCGVKIYSNPAEIIRLVDRMSCTISLTKADVPMPPTTITEDIEQAYKAVKSYEEAILKPLFSTKARGMIVLKASQKKEALMKDLEQYYQQQGFFYIQKKLELPGQDLGLVFLDGEYQGAYARVKSSGSWNTTINSGGKYAKAEPSKEIIKMAKKAQSVFNLSYTTVDIAETEQGPVCFEVSAFGGFKGAKEGLGLDMADAYADYVIKQLKSK